MTKIIEYSIIEPLHHYCINEIMVYDELTGIWYCPIVLNMESDIQKMKEVK